MGRITEDEAQKYVASNGSWFSLKNDKDVATVQFIVRTAEDVAPYLCHKIKVGDRERYVDCLASYGKECPLCHAGHEQKLVRFVTMYQHEDGQMKIWERGMLFIKSLLGYHGRFGDLTNKVFQIERNGKAGDVKTQYQLYQMPDDMAVDVSGMELPKILGGLILVKTAEELEVFLQTGMFPNTDTQIPQGTPVRQPVAAQGSEAVVPRRGIAVDRGVF